MALLDNIGNTPLIELSQLSPKSNVSIWAKCEFFNPTGSIKDRIVKYIVAQAEKKYSFNADTTLIESTSGNTGASVAMIAAIKGYQSILVIPDRVSEEKQAILRALGAKLYVMPSAASVESAEHYVNKAKAIHKALPKSFYINQYHNLQNPEAHYHTTGPEIWNQMKGQIDVFICVAGSGGTISGVGRYLKEKNPAISIIALDPISSVYYSYFKKGVVPDIANISASLVEGAGEDHLAHAMDFSVIDDIIQFKDHDAFLMARKLAQQEGIVAGGTSGANIWGALHIANQKQGPLRIVTILPDSGSKYLSKFYNDQWMHTKGFFNATSKNA